MKRTFPTSKIPFAAAWVLVALLPGEPSIAEKPGAPKARKVIGATADIVEVSSGLVFRGRVDTGAQSCSIHAEEIEVEGGSENMRSNIGKPIRFTLVDAKGKRKRVESTIVATVRVRTSERQERRYRIWLTLRHGEVERRVHVNLNDRSKMEFPLLVGRNFLRGCFVVDVAEDYSSISQK